MSWLRIAFYNLVTFPLTRILCRVKVTGRENLGALKQPVIFASNHITELDAALIMSALPPRFRNRLAIAMEGERLEGYRRPPAATPPLLRLRFFFQYWLVTALFNVFPLPKRSGFRQSFDYAGEAMDAGYNILIFPEGEMTKDGRLQKIQPGTALLADGLEAAIVPVRITGLHEQKSLGRRYYAPPGSVTISFGPPIPYRPHTDATSIVSELERQLGVNVTITS